MYTDLSIRTGTFYATLPTAWKSHPEAQMPNHVEYVRPDHVLPLTLDWISVSWNYRDDSNRLTGWYVYYGGHHEHGSHAGLTADGSALGEDAVRILTRAGIYDRCKEMRDEAIEKIMGDLREVL